jgi:transcriptional regulator with XRE-family HTH domain
MFWDNFQRICQEKGESPNGVCRGIGLSNAVATHWKNGTQPKADVLVKIAEYLDVSVDYLLGIQKKSATDDEVRSAVIEKVRSMSDEQAVQLLAFLESMLKSEK